MSFTQQQQFMSSTDESLVSFLDDIEFTTSGGGALYSDKDAGAFCSDFSCNGSPCSGSTEFGSTDSDDSLSSLFFSSQFGDDDSELGFEFTACDCDWDVSSPMPAQRIEPQQQVQQQSKPQRKKVSARAKEAGGVAAAGIVETPVLAAATTKRPRKHNRIEIIKLREQVEELEARQAKLQKFRSDRQQEKGTGSAISVSVSVATAAQSTAQNGTKLRKTAKGAQSVPTAIVAAARPRSVWFDLAVQQYKGLQESEALNRKLRDAVAKQLKVTNSFQVLLQKRVSSQDLDLLLEIPQSVAANMQTQLLNPEEQKLTELCASMERLFLETDLVCHRLATTNDITAVFSTSQAKQDAVCGPTFELMTNTPMVNSFQLLGRTMWDRIVEKKELPVITPPRRAQKTPSLLAFHDKYVQMTVPSRMGDLLVSGVVAVSKFEEAHRIVITIASTYTVGESCIVMHEHAWIIVTDTTIATRSDDESGTSSSSLWSTPAQLALFQTFYRLHSEKQDAKSATGSSPFTDKTLDDETAYVQELVMRSLSDKMRQHMTQLQSSLLSEVGGKLSTYMSEAKCPMIECGC